MTKTRTDGSAVKQLLASDRDPETADPGCGAGSSRSRDGGGAGRGETRLGYRSGYYTRSLITRVGKIELKAPQDRQGRFSTELFNAISARRRHW